MFTNIDFSGSHCLDLHRSQESDPDWLVDQRKKEVMIIQGWITDYSTDLGVPVGQGQVHRPSLPHTIIFVFILNVLLYYCNN